MESKKENKLSMYESVLEACNNQPSIQSIPALQSAINTMRSNVSDIRVLAQVQKRSIKGHAIHKAESKEKMVSLAASIANAVFAYAEVINDKPLQEKVRFKKYAVLKGRDNAAYDSCQIVLEEATKVVSSLGDFGVVAADLNILQSAIEVFNISLPKPRVELSVKANAKERLTELFAETDALLANLIDKLVTRIKETDADFFTVYSRAREIVDHGTKYTNLSGIIIDKATKLPLAKVRIEITTIFLDGSSRIEIAVSDKNGEFSFAKIESGELSIKLEKPGYKTGIEKSDIRRGKTNRIEIGLEKQ